MKHMLRIFAVTIVPIIVLVVAGCANSVTGPTDKTAPTIQVNSPASNSSILTGKNYINYSASDDQAVVYIDVYVHDTDTDSLVTMSCARFTYTNGTAPKLYMNIQSSMLGHKIYYYCVAVDAAGNKGNSVTMTDIYVNNTLSVPSAPTSLAGTLIPNTQIYNLTWTDTSSYVTGYELWKKVSLYGNWIKLKTITSLNAFNTNDNAVDTAQINLYKLRSYNSNGYSDFSPVVNSYGGGYDTMLVPPIWLSASGLGSWKTYLSWKNINDKNTIVTKFIVERKEDYAMTFVAIKLLPPTAENYTDSDSTMVPGRTYVYRIKKFSENDSVWSRTVSITPLSKPTGLRATKSLTATNAIVLTWSLLNSNATTTWVDRKSYSNQTYQRIATLSASDVAYIDSTLVVGETYTYRIITTDGKNLSDYSNEATYTLSQFSPAGKPKMAPANKRTK
jgi:hypothetical protein